MEKNYRYAIRKTTLGVGSVAIAAFLAGQVQSVQAAEGQPIELTSPLLAPVNEGSQAGPKVLTLVEDASETHKADSSQPASETANIALEVSPNQPVEAVAVPYAAEGAAVNYAMPGEGGTEGSVPTSTSGLPADTVNTPIVPASTTNPDNINYSTNEKNISEGKGYRQSELANNGISHFSAASSAKTEGVSHVVINPNADKDTDQRTYGIDISIDRNDSQRTYNHLSITDSVRNPPVEAGTKKNPRLVEYENINSLTTIGNKAVDFKPSTKVVLVKDKQQTSLNSQLNETDLQHINNHANKETTISFRDKYTTDNPYDKLLEGRNFAVTFGVNPYPNENANLSLIKVAGDTNVKRVAVKEGYVKTGARIDNLDPADYDRVVGQVYHPDGSVVKEANAFIVTPTNIQELQSKLGNDIQLGQIIFAMPKGALEDPNSIFNTNKFKGIQSLQARFFARPRTTEEFQEVVNLNNMRETGVETIEDYKQAVAEGWDYSPYKYVKTGAGIQTIKHNGKDVEIDKQGIARYDNYNDLGHITINLDDTRYYEQKFDKKLEHKDDKLTEIKPGEAKIMVIDDQNINPDTEPNRKTGKEMIKADEQGFADGVIDPDFIKKAEAEGWEITTNPNDISQFTVKAPKGAKAGEFIAIPITYTYTNGSTDLHWFHFVVQDSDNNRPEYHAEVGYQGDVLKNKPEIPKNDKKRRPLSFELAQPVYKDEQGIPLPAGQYKDKQGNIQTLQPGQYVDSAGNVWSNVQIDSTSGVVTAMVPEDVEIIGGENLYVNVRANYGTDEVTNEPITEEVKAQFIARPKYKTTVTDTDDKLIPYETKEEYDETLPAGTIQVVTPGKAGKERTIFEQDVINGQKGLVDPATGQFTAGDQLFRKRTETVEEKQDRLVKVGVKPVEETVAIPRPVEIEVDPNMEPTAEPVVVEEGQDGVVTVKTTRDPQTGAVNITKATTTPAQPKKVKVGTKTTGTVVDTDEIPFKYTVEFDPNFYKNYPDATENYKVVIPGQAGSNKKTWTIENSKVVGEPVVETVAPVNALIKVGQKDYTGSFETVDKDPIPFETEYIVDNTLEPGKEVVENPGALGEKTTTTTHTIQNGQVTASTPGQSVQSKDPVKRVVRIGAKSNGSYQVTEPIPFQVEVKTDPSLKKGEYKVANPGKPGSQTKTLTIENSQVTATSEPTINEQASNAVVLVGDQDFTGEVSHDVTEKVPFPVKVVEDPTLDKGTYHVDQEGVPGSKTTTYTQAIKNGATDGALTSTVKAESAPQEHIIRVGTKPLTGSTTVTTTSQKPFDVEIEYDATKPAGTVEVVPNTGVPGEESKTTPVTAADGTVTPGTTTTTETKAPVNKKIIVGTQGYNGEFSHEYTNVLPFETEVEVDPSLAPNAVVEVQKGQLGETTTTVSQTITNGLPGEKVVSDPVQTKAPVNRKIKVGAKTEGIHTYTEELPFSYTVEYDPAIQAGKYEIVTPGAVGSRTTEWPITNSVVGQGKVTQETPASNALIKVGNKDFTGQVSHTETVPVPNTVEIRYNPNVKAGETKVLEAGKPGSVDVTYSQAIKNGQAAGDLVKTEANRVAPVNRVIEVGTQPVSGTETPIQQNVPVEVEFVYDNTKDKGFVEAGQVTPGKTESKVVSKVVDGQVVNTVENIVTPAKQQIIVGTKDYTGEFKHTEQSIAPYRTIYKLDPTLKHGQEVVDQEGQFGLIQRQVTQDFVNGKLGEKTYGPTEEVMTPQDRIVRIGSMTDGTHTSTEEIPFAVKVEVDPSLPKGDYQVVTPGEPGTKETTVKIENSQVVGTASSKVIKEPVTQVIKVGDQDFTGEVSHNVTETLPFKVEIQEDPNLPLFEIQEVQKGENGSKTTKYSQAIKNGAADGQLKAEEIARTEPKTHIIKVGTKAPENAETRVKEVPAEIEYVYDNTKDKGVVEKGAYTPGKLETKIKNVFNPQTGQIETTTEEVLTPAKQVIVVGTKDYSGEFKHTEQSLAPFKTEYKLDPSLKAGEEVVEREGKVGLIERDVSQKYVNGTLADKVFGETREVIAPENRIVRIGAKTDGSHTSTEEIPFDVKVEVDPTLTKGEYRVVTPGQPGTKETTVSIENSQIVGEPVSKVTKEPVAQVIKVGKQDFTGQVKHTERFEVPYKVEVRENPNLKAGETKLIQQGQPGSYDVTYTQAIKNGQADGELAKAITKPVQPKAHIIEVGTKPVAGNSHESHKDVPVETIFEYDPSLDKGKVENVQVVPGHVTTQIVNKVVDGKVVTEEVPVVTPAKHIVKVGTKGYEGQFSHESFLETPFATEVIYDDQLDSGKVEEVQAGQPGQVKETVTQAIINGVLQDKKINQEVLREPQKRIIRVGIKQLIKEVPVEKIVEIVKEVPVEKVVEVVKEVPVEVIKEVPVEVIKEVPVEIIKDCPGIEVVYNKDLKPGQVKVVDPGEKRITETRDGKTIVKQEGRKMIVEVGCGKTENPTSDSNGGKLDPQGPKDPEDGNKQPEGPKDPQGDKDQSKDPQDPQGGKDQSKDPQNPQGDKDQSKDPQNPQGGKEQSKDPQNPQGNKDQSKDPKEPESGHKDPQNDGKDPQNSDKDKLPSKDPETADHDKLKDKDHSIPENPKPGHKDPSSVEKVPSSEETRQNTKPEAVKLNADQVTVLTAADPAVGQAEAYTPLTQLPATGSEDSASRFHPAVLTLMLGLGLVAFSTKKKKA